MNIPSKGSILCFALFLIVSCRVMLIGAYDEVADQSIQKIQNDVSSLLIKIEKNIINDDIAANNYANFKTEYNDIEGQLQSLQIRCNALPKYKTVVDQLTSFDSTIRKLEKFHSKLGFALSDTASIRIIKETIQFDFKQMIILQNALKRKSNKE